MPRAKKFTDVYEKVMGIYKSICYKYDLNMHVVFEAFTPAENLSSTYLLNRLYCRCGTGPLNSSVN